MHLICQAQTVKVRVKKGLVDSDLLLDVKLKDSVSEVAALCSVAGFAIV